MGKIEATRSRSAHHCLREGVLGGLLNGGRPSQQLVSAQGAQRHQVGQSWASLRYGSGLVQHHHFHSSRALERAAITHQHAELGSFSHRYHDRDGCCESERTWARYHQDGHRHHRGEVEAGLGSDPVPNTE